MQARNRPLPGAVGRDTRSRSSKLFEVEVVVGGESLARATGRSKKDAEQAARLALINLNNAG